MTATTLNVDDWESVAEGVITRGFHRLRGAISNSSAADLMAAASKPWHALVPHEGGGEVYQAGFATGIPLERAEPFVRGIAAVITDSMTAALPAETPSLPPFNEVSWTRYPVGVGHITAHRDPPGCGGVIAIANLAGSAVFYVGRRGEPDGHEWIATPGDVVILQANAWPDERARCPLHGVEAPPVGERAIMTLRHNQGGAGADYFARVRGQRSR